MAKIPFGEGGDEALGSIKSSAGFEYKITWQDLLWCIRMLEGETGGDTGAHSAAVLWSQTQAFVIWQEKGRARFSSFFSYLRSHSQPINPKWAEGGSECAPGTSNHGTPACSPEAFRRRAEVTSRSWDYYSSDLQNLVLDWAKGRLPNPVPKSTDFASNKLASVPERIQNNLLVYVWDSRNIGSAIQQSDPSSNVFVYWNNGGSRDSSDWPPDHVWVELNGNIASDSSPVGVSQNRGVPLPDSQTGQAVRRVVSAPPDILDRIQSITQGRTSPPSNSKYQYFIVSGSDPHTNNIFPTISSLRSPYDTFNNQMSDLRSLSTLDLNATVPVLEIFTTDGSGNIINLSEEIFSESPVPKGIDNPFLDHSERFPERPLASVENFTVDVQSPAVGGPTGIVVGTLNLKVHNPSIVNSSHPKGKYIAWMLRQGWVIKIRYGMAGQRPGLVGSTDMPGVKTKTEDFFISHHQISIDNDLSMKIKLTVLPAASKLMNQVLIGESINIKELEGVTTEDISNALVAALSEDTTREQISELKRQLNQFSEVFNRNVRLIGTEGVQRTDGTLGSILHGTVTNLDIIKQPGNFNEILVRNFSESLQGIQSSLLSRRFEKVIRKNGYRAKIRSGVDFLAINAGPLIEEMVLPEVKKVVRHASETGLSLGVEGTVEEDITARTKVKVVFGNFNANAGERANKPISTFPIDLENIFAHIRERRQVGRFSDSVNNFIGRIASSMTSRTFYVGRRDSVSSPQSEGDNLERGNSIVNIEIPQIKYSLYPDPLDESAWIFYVYDNKEIIVNISNLLHELREDEEGALTVEEIKQKCAQYKIPWIELGTDSALVKSLNASTVGDDMLMSSLMYAANNGANQRRIDGQPEIPPGMSAEWLSGMRDRDPQEVIRDYPIIMPLQMKMGYFITTDAVLFSHVYVFFPIPQFSGLYTIYELGHEVNRTTAESQYTLQINITDRNRIQK